MLHCVPHHFHLVASAENIATEHRSGMAGCLRLAIWSLVIVLAAGDNPCANSNNSDVGSVKECKYLSPCTKADVPAAESGYTIE